VTSGWGGQGVDLYRRSAEGPRFEETVRTRGWGPSSLHRDGDDLYLAGGHFGAQVIPLK
jgi:hypothetical protein